MLINTLSNTLVLIPPSDTEQYNMNINFTSELNFINIFTLVTGIKGILK